jgi:recombination protein RecT
MTTTTAVQVRIPTDHAAELRRVKPYLSRLGIDAERFTAAVFVAYQRTPDIAACAAPSVIGAALVCAQLDLEPGPAEHVWLIPRRNRKQGNRLELTILLGKNGMKALAERHPDIRSVRTGTICENDEYTHVEEPPSLTHTPNHADRGDPILWYAIADRTDNGPPHIAVLDRKEVAARRKHSASPDNGPWVTHFDAMARKSAIRALWPELPSSLDLSRAALVDDTAGAVTAEALGAIPDEDDQIEVEVERDAPTTVRGEVVDEETGEIIAEGDLPPDTNPEPDDEAEDAVEVEPDDPSDGDGDQGPATAGQLKALGQLQELRSLDDHDLLQVLRDRFDVDADDLDAGLASLTIDQAGQLIVDLQPAD